MTSNIPVDATRVIAALRGRVADLVVDLAVKDAQIEELQSRLVETAGEAT